MDLATAPWNEKLTIENFDEGIRYIYEESQKENDQLPSLIRLFSDDILDDKNKLIGFAILMKRLDMAIKGNAKIEQYADILHLFEEYFPGIEDGMVLKYNFLSQIKMLIYETLGFLSMTANVLFTQQIYKILKYKPYNIRKLICEKSGISWYTPDRQKNKHE